MVEKSCSRVTVAKQQVRIFVFVCLFGCTGSQLQHANFLVVTCGIQFPDQGMTLGPLCIGSLDSQSLDHLGSPKNLKPGLTAQIQSLITVLQCSMEFVGGRNFSSTSDINKLLSTSSLLLPVRNEICNDMTKLVQAHLTPNQKVQSIVDKPAANHLTSTFPEQLEGSYNLS